MRPADSQLDRELVAALVWDLPHLEEGSVGAKAFAAALGPDSWIEPEEEGEGPLWDAALAVVADRQRGDDLLDTYRGLAERDGLTRVLGLMLVAWTSANKNLQPVEEAANEARGVEDSQLQARLLAKCATFALDKGYSDAGRSLFTEAINSALPGSELARALMVEGLNLGIRQDPAIFDAHDSVREIDPLVQLPWIENLCLSSARNAMAHQVEHASQAPWSWTIRAGRTPLQEIVSAEAQASWAGALWIRRPIRKQLGAFLLGGWASTPEQWAYGVVMWTLGGGANPERMVNVAEPHLDTKSGDSIVRSLAEDATSQVKGGRVLAVAAEAWDLLSDDTLTWLIDHVEPMAGEAPQAAYSRAIWAGFSVRVPDAWSERYRDLDPALQQALLDSFTPAGVTHLSSQDRELVFTRAREAIAGGEAADPALWNLAASLAQPNEIDGLRAMADRIADPISVAFLRSRDPSLVSHGATEKALGRLVESAENAASEARQGTVGFGPRSVWIELGRLISTVSSTSTPGSDPLGQVRDRGIELLLATAVDGQLPAEYVLQSRQALTLVRRGRLLSSSAIKRLRGAPDAVGLFAGHGNISADLMEVSRLQVLATHLVADDRARLVAAVRDTDPRVRQVAISTAAETIESKSDSALVWSLVSGFFDPNDYVVLDALNSISWKALEKTPAAVNVIVSRLPALYEDSGRDVRVAVVRVAREALELHPRKHSKLRGFVRLARSDRSWLVRAAAFDPLNK